MSHAVVVGAGIFGVTAALELRARGWRVTLIDPGPIPHELAESTDISKIVRLDYGSDVALTAWMERALPMWRSWNTRWSEHVFHETGILFLSGGPLDPASFEGQSAELLSARGHAIERLDADALATRFPAWKDAGFSAAYFNPQGGYAESGRVVALLAADAAAAGVEVRAGVTATGLLGDEGVTGVQTDAGPIAADEVIVAAGAWTGHLLPHLAGVLTGTGQAVVHFKPADLGPFLPAVFPVFCADIATTGRYGFPAGREGVVKLGHHAAGRPMHPSGPERVVTEAEEQAARAFVAPLAGLADAPIVHRRVCVYGDSLDGDFWIGRDRQGLVVAAGGSGHGFKFAPVLGELVADVVEGRPHALAARFARRQGGAWKEEARAVG